MERQASWRLPLLGVLLAALLGGVGYFAGRLLQPGTPSQSVAELALSGDCVPLGRECVARGRDPNTGPRIGLRLEESVSPLRPFPVEVTVRDMPSAATAVSVDFIMTGMDMGMNRYRLVQARDRGTHGPWRGRSTLPVCSADRLDWVAVVMVETAEGTYQARFPFRATPLR
ncbi:MAG: hypothetical protein P8009_05315 [Gammaproteobacteria bacterium]